MSKEDLFYLFQKNDSSDLGTLQSVHANQASLQASLSFQNAPEAKQHLVQIFDYFQEQDSMELFEIYLTLFCQQEQQQDL